MIEQRDASLDTCWPAAEFRRLMESHGTSRPDAEPISDPATGRRGQLASSTSRSLVRSVDAAPSPSRRV